jgi:hypothetical protein
MMVDILEAARSPVFPTIDQVETWANMMHDGGDDSVQREVDMVRRLSALVAIITNEYIGYTRSGNITGNERGQGF